MPVGYDGHSESVGGRPHGRQRPADLLLVILVVLGSVLSVCIGGAVALIAVIPKSALWMGPLVCPSPYRLAYSTSGYSYKPGQSGTSVDFACVSGASSYDANVFAIDGIQSLVIALVLCVVAVAVSLVRRRSRRAN